MIKKSLRLLVVFSLTILCSFAADKAPKAPKTKTKKADKVYTIGQYYTASALYKKAYAKFNKSEQKGWAAYRAGECARMVNNNSEAEDWYGKAVKAKYKDPMSILRYAEALKSNGKYAEAIAQYNSYKEKNPTDSKVDGKIKECEQAQAWNDKPTRAKVENVSGVNSKYHEFALCENPASKGSLVFTSSREESTGSKNDNWYGEKYFDIFQATKDNNGKWSTPTVFPSPANSDNSDGAACFDATGKTMYFTTCPVVKDKNMQCKIMMTTLADGKWSAPVSLPFNSDNYTCGHPSLSADGKTLYFASDMPGGLGGKDIWMSSWDASAGAWGTPINAGSVINSDGDDMFPRLTSSGRLYYASNGKPGMGGLDMFYSANEAGLWSEPVNLQSPINSGADDFGVIMTSETTGYFSSSRAGGQGGDDIYSFVIPPVKLKVGGRVYDTDTKENIEGATVELFGSDGTSLSVTTSADGLYTYELKANVKYKISASFTGYLTKFHELSTVGIEEDKDFTKDFDFPLKSTKKPITVPMVFYDLNKATLRAESKTALDGLIKTLTENPTLTIKVTSHTDYRADDKYNMDLSNRRAKSVMDYLVANAIPADRLTFEGKGETTPKAIENDDEYKPFKRGDVLTKEFIDGLASKELKEEAHQYNRRTEFEVTGATYVPKN